MKIPLDSLKKIHKYFINSGESLCVAESCTGGLLSFYLTHLPGASKYFKGGLVSYQTEVKIALLGLKVEKIKKEGLVTKDCALSMAQGVKKLLNTNWAVSVTGIAGPDKGNLGEKVGKIAFSVSSPWAEKSSIQYFNGPERKDIRRQSAFFALDFLVSGFK